MTITRKTHPNRSQEWINSKNNGFISRDASGKFWCEDDQGFVYSFGGLLRKVDRRAGFHGIGPAYMRAIAPRAARDLREGGA